MSNLKEAAQQALEALEHVTESETFYRDPRGDEAGPAIDALRNAIIQPDDEAQPVEAWHGDRKVSVYADTVLRSWGSNIETQMSTAPRTAQEVQDAFVWLYIGSKAQPVAPDFDDFVDCDECNGVGFRDVERQVAERKSDVQTFREECESCGGSGKEYKGRPLYAAPQQPAAPAAVTGPSDGYELIHRASQKVHRTVHPGAPLVLDSWEERECEVRTVPRPCESCGGTGAGSGNHEWCDACHSTGRAAAPAPQPPAEQGAELSDEQMVALQKAWYGVGADMAGLKWGDFVAVLAADRAARGGAV